MAKKTLLRIKKHRMARGLTQLGLAEKAGFSGAYVARIEQGLHDPPLSTIVRLAKVLKVKPSALLP